MGMMLVGATVVDPCEAVVVDTAVGAEEAGGVETTEVKGVDASVLVGMPTPKVDS